MMKLELMTLIALMTDAYKLFHRQMYPTNTVTVYSNSTARSSKHFQGKNKDYSIVANQLLVRKLKDEWQLFFDTEWSVLEPFIKEQLSSFTGTDYDINHLKYLHDLGYLPLVIKSLPDGSKCPIGVPDMTFYNTDEKCFWLTNYIETWLSNNGWMMSNSATLANEYREIFEKWSMKTVGNVDMVPIQGHDFSMRGMAGLDAAIQSGVGHLFSFCGTDTIPAYLAAQKYYDAPVNNWTKLATKGWMNSIVATSVPATEHSVQCAHWNEKAMNDAGYTDELEYLDHILKMFPTGVVSLVCDGMDFFGFITITLPQRKAEIMARDGKLVIRPDSGDPADIICGNAAGVLSLRNVKGLTSEAFYWHSIDLGNGYPASFVRDVSTGQMYEVKKTNIPGYVILKKTTFTNEQKGAIEILWDEFGGTETEKGFNLLDSHIGLIYGDSINLGRAENICSRLADKGFASINWVAGIGSFTYQFNTRDSLGRAFKATYIELKEELCSDHRTFKKECTHSMCNNNPTFCSAGFGEMKSKIISKNIFKDPKTGDGMKKSAKGLLQVVYTANMATGYSGLKLKTEVSWEEENKGFLRLIFKNGELHNQDNLFTVRKRLKDG